MPFTQQARDCQEHPDCTVIVGIDDEREVWWSHMTSDVAPEIRINLDYPEVADHRGGAGGSELAWRMPDQAEAEKLGWDADTHRRVAFEAGERQLEPRDELAAKTGLTEAELDALANAKGWRRRAS